MLYADLLVDADGIPLTGDEALVSLHAAANAPMFGIHDFQLGKGIVGGPLVPVRELARRSASAAPDSIRRLAARRHRGQVL